MRRPSSQDPHSTHPRGICTFALRHQPSVLVPGEGPCRWEVSCWLLPNESLVGTQQLGRICVAQGPVCRQTRCSHARRLGRQTARRAEPWPVPLLDALPGHRTRVRTPPPCCLPGCCGPRSPRLVSGPVHGGHPGHVSRPTVLYAMGLCLAQNPRSTAKRDLPPSSPAHLQTGFPVGARLPSILTSPENGLPERKSLDPKTGVESSHTAQQDTERQRHGACGLRGTERPETASGAGGSDSAVLSPNL